MTGTGNLGEDVAGATFDLEMTGAIGKLVSCKVMQVRRRHAPCLLAQAA